MEELHLKKKSDMHWARKIWHMVSVFIIFGLYRLLPPIYSQILITLGWLIFVPVDFLRLKNKNLNDLLIHLFRPIIRKTEVHKLAGTSYLLTGVFILVFFFSRDIASLSLLFLAFADPLASVIGIKYGRDKIFGHKSIQGFIAAYFVCFLCSFIFLYSVTIPSDRLFVFSLLAALIGALAELIPIARVDDNFTLPILSATGLYFLFLIFGF